MGVKIQEKIPEIDTRTGMSTCSGDLDFYLELFQDFVQVPIKDELKEFLEKKDSKNYCIRIHGFKNIAYSIGAKELGQLAFEMEKQTREEFPEDIEELQGKFFDQFDRICQKYKEIQK